MQKHLFLTALLVAVLALNARAQFSIGLSAGPNLTFWKWEVAGTDLNLKAHHGARGAFLAEWQANTWLGIRGEMGYQIRTSLIKLDLVLEDGTMISGIKLLDRYHFLESSMLAKVSPLAKERNLFFLAGATYTHMAQIWHKISGAASLNAGWEKQEINDEAIERNQLMAEFGAGMAFPVTNSGRFNLEVRCQLGFADFIQSPNSEEGRYSTVLFTAGYLLRL